MNSWSNVPGTFATELVPEFDPPQCLKDFIGCELVIEFESTGYYDPGCRYTRNGDGWPPGGDDERQITAAYILRDGERIDLPEDIHDDLTDHYSDQIHAAELNESDPPDRLFY